MFNDNQPFAYENRTVDVLIMAAGTILALAIALSNGPSVAADPPDHIGLFGAMSAGKKPTDSNVVAGTRLIDVLETTPDRESVGWRSVETGVAYRINVLTSFSDGLKNCRTFKVRRTEHGNVRESFRTACREENGVWRVMTYPDADPANQTESNQR